MIDLKRIPWYPIFKALFALFFVVAGVGHLISPSFYLKIMPPYLPWPYALVIISGLFEIALGVCLLIPRLSCVSAWGIIALLLAVFPANIYLFQHQEILPAPPIGHLLRLPGQALLIAWAFVYTRPPRVRDGS